MKAFYFIFGLLIAVALSAGAQPAVVDGVKGVVSARVVTFAEVEDYSRPAVDALRRQYSAEPDVFQQKLNDTLSDPPCPPCCAGARAASPRACSVRRTRVPRSRRG